MVANKKCMRDIRFSLTSARIRFHACFSMLLAYFRRWSRSSRTRQSVSHLHSIGTSRRPVWVNCNRWFLSCRIGQFCGTKTPCDIVPYACRTHMHASRDRGRRRRLRRPICTTVAQGDQIFVGDPAEHSYTTAFEWEARERQQRASSWLKHCMP